MLAERDDLDQFFILTLPFTISRGYPEAVNMTKEEVEDWHKKFNLLSWA